MKTKYLKETKAITLIALVVTIVVLLILAGVSIAVLTGENGILNRATEAKTTNEQKTAEEELKLGIAALSTDYYSKTTRPATFRDFIFTDDSKTKLNQEVNGGATFNNTNYTITYKNVTYQVSENGGLSIAEGIVLLDTLTLISGVDETYQLTAEQKNIDAPNLSWTSSNPSVATIGSTTGLVTVAGQGTTKITVSGTYNNKNYSAECNVIVTELVVELEETKEIVIGGNEEVSLTITPVSVASREDITVNWTSTAISPNIWSATFDSATGLSTNVGVPQGTTANTTAKITTTIKKGETTITTKNCTITAITSPWIDSSYVQYDVEYTDVYTGTEYKANTGWRLITKIEEDTQHYNAQAGTYEGDIEIISTGVPAKLYYDYNTITSFVKSGITKGLWAGDLTDRSNYVSAFYGTASNNNVYAASGLFYNFGNIVYKVIGTRNTLHREYTGVLYNQQNYGGYIAISNNGTIVTAGDTTTGDNLFKVNNIACTAISVRSVNLNDIKDDGTETITTASDKRIGLFKLEDYTKDVHNNSYYWLASPSETGKLGLAYVYKSGEIFYSSNIGDDSNGVRPIVSINGVKLKRSGNVWKIIANSNS